MHASDRRLIEDLIPIREISAEASREKSLRHGNISTLHLWWARRPIVAARAAVYGALVPASTTPDERKIHKDFMKKLCRWDVSQSVIEEARQHILQANNGQPPRVLDMFAGGGSIPLEALRLGCEAYAVDLNPVAHIIELCTLVYPQKYGASLIADVKKWGTWIIDQAREQLTEFYPTRENDTGTKQNEILSQFSFTDEPASVCTNNTLTPVAYLWTRTVTCPNPTCGATVPLVRQTWLRKKTGGYVALRMTPDHATKQVRFEVVKSPTVEDLGFDPEVGSKRGNTVCPFCGAPVNSDCVKQEGKAGRIGQQLISIVATYKNKQGKIYLDVEKNNTWLPPIDSIQKNIIKLCESNDLTLPEEPLPREDSKNFWVVDYGLTRFVDLFTPRQLLSLLTFTALIHQAHHLMLEEGIEESRAVAITTYLGLMVDRLADFNSSLCRWVSVGDKVADTYARQALPMVWDFAEINPLGNGSGNCLDSLERSLSALEKCVDCGKIVPQVQRASATRLPLEDLSLDAIITDPPYYDNVSYADLSDFFYVWLKRSIGFLYPEHFSTPLTPKKQEAIMASYRHNKSKGAAKTAYETMMARAFSEAHRVLKPGAPLVCVYAHKTTLGWSTLIEALRYAGFVIVEAWPLDTERPGRSTAIGTAALASSIFLVARKRENEQTGDYVSQVRPQLASIIDERLTTLIEAGVTGADLIIATIGAGLRAYTQYARVEMPNGDELDAATYLAEIEREVAYHVLQRLLQATESGPGGIGVQIAAVDTVTRFYVTARFFYNESAAPFDDMNLLARGMGVELDGPYGLFQGKKGLAKKEKDTIQLRDYRERGDDEALGLPTQSGNPSSLIDLLHRLLWLQEKSPYEVADFLIKARPHTDQLRMVAQALSGHALAPAGEYGSSKQERSEEQKAVDRLLAGWRGIFSEMGSGTLWG
jgi:putative DNA methylase